MPIHRHGSLSVSLFDDAELDRPPKDIPSDHLQPSEGSSVVALNNDSDPIFKAGEIPSS
jgi:hypothetical protein